LRATLSRPFCFPFSFEPIYGKIVCGLISPTHQLLDEEA
jgi:hypothetical protein